MYLDDGRVLAANTLECEVKAKFVLHIFQLCGFNIQWKKTNLVSSQVAVYQGFVTNTILMRYFLRPEKFLEVLALIQETISKLDQQFLFTARKLASVLGKIHSLNRSHGSIVSVMTRHIQHVVGREVFYNGWTTQVSLDSRCRRELAFLQEHLIAFNGKLIPASKSGARVVCYEEISQLIQRICYSEEMVSNLIISDASDTTAFVFLKDKFVQTKEFEFDAEERDLSFRPQRVTGDLEVSGRLQTEQGQVFILYSLLADRFKKQFHFSFSWFTQIQNTTRRGIHQILGA